MGNFNFKMRRVNRFFFFLRKCIKRITAKN